MEQPENSPDYVREEVKALAPARARSRTLAAGTDAVHAAGTALLPQWPGEDNDVYATRATLTETFDAYGRTVEAAVGLLFGADPTIEGVPAALQPVLDDADGHGTDLTEFARAITHHATLDGIAGVLVDYPTVAEPGRLSLRDVQERGLRPYCVAYRADQIINWRTARVGARTVFTLLVLREAEEVAVGDYGVTSEPRYRVFRREPNGVTVAVYAIDQDAVGRKTVRELQPPLPIVGPTEIPFAIAYSRPKLATLMQGPPLDRLAWLNLGHYRVSADHRYLMGICHAPTLAIEGSDPEDTTPIALGVNRVLRLSGVQKAMWLQADPDALSAAEKTMERQQAQMGALGMAFLARDRSARTETATGRALDAAADQATLGTLADGVAACLVQALTFAAAYMNEAAAPVVTIRPDYDASRLDAQTIAALNAVAVANNLSLETFLTVLKGGNVLPDGLNVEEELARILIQRTDLTRDQTQDAAAVAA